MLEIAHALSSFLPNAQVAPVSSVDQPVYILTSDQLQAIIATTTLQAQESLKDRLSTLEATITALRQEIIDLKASQETDTSHLAASIAQDRRRLSQLEQSRIPTPAPLGDKTTARIEKLKEFLKARGGGVTFQEVERLLNIRPNQMTKLVSMLDKRSFEVFARSGDRRQRVIRLKARIIQ